MPATWQQSPCCIFVFKLLGYYSLSLATTFHTASLWHPAPLQPVATSPLRLASTPNKCSDTHSDTTTQPPLGYSCCMPTNHHHWTTWHILVPHHHLHNMAHFSATSLSPPCSDFSARLHCSSEYRSLCVINKKSVHSFLLHSLYNLMFLEDEHLITITYC